MRTLAEFWSWHEVQYFGHIKPTTADIWWWTLLVGAPALFFVMNGGWYWALCALCWSRVLIPQWGLPQCLRWSV